MEISLNRYTLTMALAILAMALAAGVQRDTSATIYPAGVNKLGISEFRVEQTASELQIIGLDSRKVRVGKLNLRVTDVGRNLTLDVHGEKVSHESKGTARLHLPLLPRKGKVDLNAFLADSHVSSELERWGVILGPRPKPRAADAPTHACTFAENPAALGTGCCEMPAPNLDAVEEFVCIGDREGYGFVDRICTKPSDPNNPCGPTGPNGCAVCWTASATNYCRTAGDPDDPSRCTYEFR